MLWLVLNKFNKYPLYIDFDAQREVESAVDTILWKLFQFT